MDSNSQEQNIDSGENINHSQENSIISTIPPNPDNPQKVQEAITQEIDTLTAGFLDGSLNYDKYLSKLTDLDQIDSAHKAAFNIWDTLNRQDIADKIFNSQPISKPMQMEDGTTEDVSIDPKEQYYNVLGLEYLHVMQILAIFENKPTDAKEFLFKDPKIIEQIRQYSLSDPARDYLDGTLAYWQGDIKTLHSIMINMESNLGETDIEKEMNGLNLDVIKRLYKGLEDRGTVDYAKDYAGVETRDEKV